MADEKVSALTALATPTDDDLVYVVNDPAGTPDGRKTTIAQLRAVISPVALCHLTKSSAHTCHATPFTYTNLSWQTEVEDTHAFHDGGTPTTAATIPAGMDGAYMIIGDAGHEQGSDRRVDVQILKNGATVLGYGQVRALSGTCRATAVDSLAAGDTIEIQVQSGTASQSLASHLLRFQLIRVA